VELYVEEKNFSSLFESVAKMDEIVRGERKKSREFHIDTLGVTGSRKKTGTDGAESSHG
jgi:putative transcriptional regulator